MKRRLRGILAVLVLGAVTGVAWAEETKGAEGDRPSGTEGLKVTTAVKRQVHVVNEKGEKEMRLEDVKTAVPGEELVMIIFYDNPGREPATNVVLVYPVPEQMSYVGGSARGDETVATFSVDGGVSYDAPENLFIAQADGTKRPAMPAEYTHVRWVRTSPLAPDSLGETRLRVVIK